MDEWEVLAAQEVEERACKKSRATSSTSSSVAKRTTGAACSGGATHKATGLPARGDADSSRGRSKPKAAKPHSLRGCTGKHSGGEVFASGWGVGGCVGSREGAFAHGRHFFRAAIKNQLLARSSGAWACGEVSAASPVVDVVRGPKLSAADERSKLHFGYPYPPVQPTHWGSPVLTVGSDFAGGLNSFVLALRVLGIPHSELFSCDKDGACRRMLGHHYPSTKIFYGDISERVADHPPHVDVYTSTFPCQPFAPNGNQLGPHDPRGSLFDHSLQYITARRPKLVLLENVKNLYVRFPTYFHSIVRSIEKLGYNVCNKKKPVMQCMEHGLPQNRERLILVCIRSDCYTTKFCAPTPLRHVIKLKVRCGE